MKTRARSRRHRRNGNTAAAAQPAPPTPPAPPPVLVEAPSAPEAPPSEAPHATSGRPGESVQLTVEAMREHGAVSVARLCKLYNWRPHVAEHAIRRLRAEGLLVTARATTHPGETPYNLYSLVEGAKIASRARA